MTNALDRAVQQRPAPLAHVTQTTAVEQSRAVAEVQAAVVVAQNCPRDITRAYAEMQEACGRSTLANRAFYRVPNRGSGASVHLARELARIWGNIQFGVHELHRDDVAGMSEIQAFAWDVQTNSRTTRTFQVPHQRMKKVNGRQTREDLVDLGDVYLNNQNVGARAVRECIFNVLPDDFTETAQDLCNRTLRDGDGQPLPQRIEQMVGWFGQTYGVRQPQLEEKLGKKRGQWDAGDVATLKVLGTSLQRGEVTVDEEFPAGSGSTAKDFAPSGPAMPPAQQAAPPADVDTTTGEVKDTEPAAAPKADSPADDQPKITLQQQKLLFKLFKAKGIPEDEQLAGIAHIIGRPIESRTAMTEDEWQRVIDRLEQLPDGGARASTEQDGGDQA